MAGSATAGLLQRQLKLMQTSKDIPGISCGLVDDNVFEWEVMLMMSDECRYYGGRSGSFFAWEYACETWEECEKSWNIQYERARVSMHCTDEELEQDHGK